MRRFLTKLGVKQAGERQVRQAQKAASFGTLTIKYKNLQFDNPDTNTKDTHSTPVAYIENLPEFVTELLDKYKAKNMLTSHSGGIPKNEIWIKVGGDHGGGSMKVMLQVGNVNKPNSKHHTYLICMANAKDTHHNLRTILTPLQKEFDNLKQMQWRNKQVRLFMFGDYDFLLKTLGLSSAASKHPCCYCKASNDEYQTKPAARPEPVIRSYANLMRNYRAFVVKGGRDKKKAKSTQMSSKDPF